MDMKNKPDIQLIHTLFSSRYMLCKEKEKKRKEKWEYPCGKLQQTKANAVDLTGGKNSLFKSDKTLIKIMPAKNNETTQTII